ncbi:MAG TPA: gamma-glutamyltransferase family protein, partial [Hyphomicrobiaceae bacterium]|nr:gamma-glutamyltransferase family protein [Hyphomicrobiaceae bacterium]
MRNLHFPGRSPVYAQNAMCATSHPLATEAAIGVLRSGGNAVDAALTAASVLCVVEHPMTGIGGDCFALISKPGQKPFALNASGRAPAALTAELLLGRGIKSIETTSPHAVTVPGAVDGWFRLSKDHGTMPLGKLLERAIGLARDGFPVAPRVAFDWAGSVPKLSGNEGGRKHMLFDGASPRAGQVIRLPALARSLQQIADGGRDAFYEGEIAADIVRDLGELGGVHTMADFAAQTSSYVDPISVTYGGLDILELPPNNHGVVVLIMLKMMEKMGRISDDPLSAERYHLMLEAARLAYRMRDEFVADPEMADVPLTHMLDDRTISELVGRIDKTRRLADLGPVPQPTGTDTVYFSIVDQDGMGVAFINSLFADFGSGIVSRDTGVVLQNRGQGFVVEPGHRNCVAPRKRPLHTLIPALAMKNGTLDMVFGVMGGAFQPA